MDAMIIKAGKKIDKEKIDKKIKQLEKKKLFDASLHKNKVKWGEDALEYQQRIRDEWNEHSK